MSGQIENEWKRLDRLRERMTVLFVSKEALESFAGRLFGAFFGQVLDINCSGKIFKVPKRLLRFIEGLSFLFEKKKLVKRRLRQLSEPHVQRRLHPQRAQRSGGETYRELCLFKSLLTCFL